MRGSRLAEEPFLPGRGVGVARRKDLERHWTLQRGIVCEPHLSHAALSEAAGDGAATGGGSYRSC